MSNRSSLLSKWVVVREAGKTAALLGLGMASVALSLSVQANECPDAKLEGSLKQGGLIRGLVEPGTLVTFAKRDVRVSPRGHFVFGLGRDTGKSVTLHLSCPEGGANHQTLAVEQRQYDIQRIDGLPGKKVNPPKERLERIRRENAQVGSARKKDRSQQEYLGGFQWPAIGRISGVYGSQRVLNGTPKRPHYGVDVAGPVGTQIVSPAAGLVTLVHKDMYYSGGTLIIDHGHGVSSTFIHLSEILVEEGQMVKPGDSIAKMGATGRATGSHLDWRVNWFNHRLDPQLLVGKMPKQATSAN